MKSPKINSLILPVRRSLSEVGSKPFNPVQDKRSASNVCRCMDSMRRWLTHHERFFITAKKLPAYILIGIFKTIRPLLGPASCKFYPSCGNYAVEQLKKESLFKALKNTAWQLLRCNPFF